MPREPITLEHLTLLDVGDDNLGRNIVLFDPDDINGAIGELTDRWIASGEVAHPDVIDAEHRVVDAVNRHAWDALAIRCAGATYINHRQLAEGNDTIDDFISSIAAIASLVPDLWIESAEILAYSASGVVTYYVVKGTSIEGMTIEIPFVELALVDGDRVTHIEIFDPDQSDLALTRFGGPDASGPNGKL